MNTESTREQFFIAIADYPSTACDDDGEVLHMIDVDVDGATRTGNGDDHTRESLEPITLGLGAVNGYSGADLTNPRTAVLAGEVPFLHAADASHPVLELRVHGVGGAPASDNLETPSVMQVAGDQQAGFYRPWFPGGSARGRRRLEAYCWGGLNYRALACALWLLLLPFGLVNVAHWALPDLGRGRLPRATRAMLRLLGLVLTATFVATTAYLLGDLLAWQAASTRPLWRWLHFFTYRSPGTRLTIAMLAVLAIVAVLWVLSIQTQGRYEKRESGHWAPDDSAWELSRRSMWCGELPLVRQRWAHLIVAGAVVQFVEVLPHSSLQWLRVAGFGLAGLFTATAAVIVLSRWSDRIESAGTIRTGRTKWTRRTREGRRDAAAQLAAWGSLGLAATFAVTRVWWVPRTKDSPVIPGDPELQIVLLLTGMGLIVLLLVLVFRQSKSRVSEDPSGPMAAGFTAVVLALLAVLIAGVFGGSLTMTVANVLAKPTTDPSKLGPDLVVPSSVYASGLAIVVAVVSTRVTGIVLLLVRNHHARELRGSDPGTPADVYKGFGAETAEPGGEARTVVARTWATSGLTDGAAGVLLGVAVPTALALVTYQGYQLAGRSGGWLGTVARFGTSAGVLGTGALLVYLRSALANAAQRKRLSFCWDIVTFWPRACHPLGPPSYGERSIPELVTRIRRVVGDRADGKDDPAVAQQQAEKWAGPGPREEHSPVLLVGYSQGSPIVIAVVSQLPDEVRRRVALLTLAAPVRRLYGRAFPAVYGPQQLRLIRDGLKDEEADRVRWRNLIRRSDYIGGWALSKPPDRNAVDREILDPPVLWANADPAPPPIHLHSDWFADPQTRSHAVELSAMLVENSYGHRNPWLRKPMEGLLEEEERATP